MAAKQGEIARIAGVSRQAVSLAINHPSKLHPETLARIQRAIEQVGYVPNEAARNFQKGRSSTIGMVFRIFSEQDFSTPFLALTLKGLHEAASKAGYGVRFQPFTDAIDLDAFCRSKVVDGFVYMTYRSQTDREQFLALAEKDYPFVVFSKDEGLPSLDMDYQGGLAHAVIRLVEAGRKNIVYVGGGLDQDFNQEKFKGFLRGMAHCKLDPRDRMIFHDCWRIEDGEKIVRYLRSRNIEHDAIIAADSDILAVGVLNELKRQGIQVPGQVSLIAGDGSLYSRCTDPILSSVHAPYDVRAAAAVEMLVHRIKTGSNLPFRHIPMGFQEGMSLKS